MQEDPVHLVLFSQAIGFLQVFLRSDGFSAQTSTVTGRKNSELSQNTKGSIMSSKLVIRQPQPVMDSRESDQWGSGICDCCDNVPECCFAFWCYPCFACKTSRDYGQCLCLPLLDIGFIPPITMSMRVSMRERYGIKDTMCRDCVYATFCTACSWCQMSREMKRRNIQIVLVSAKNS